MRIRGMVFLVIAVVALISGCRPGVAPAITLNERQEGFDTSDYNIIFSDALKQKMLGDQGNAIRLFERALKLNQNSDASCYQLSILYQSAGDYRRAVNYAVKAEKLDDGNQWYVNNAGMQYYMIGRYDSAEYYFEKLVDLEPGREDYKLMLEGLYEQNGKFGKSIDIINEFIDKYGEQEELLVALVRIYSMWGKTGEQEEAIGRLINTGENKINSYGLLAEFYKQQDMEDAAGDVYEQMFTDGNSSPELILSYLDYLRIYKKYDEFFDDMASAIINDSISVEGKLNLFTSILGDSIIRHERKRDVELMTLIFATNYSNIPEAVLLSAQIFESIGVTGRAASVLREYCEKNTGNYLMWERLLIIYNIEGNIEELYNTAKYVATRFNLYPLPKLLYAFAAAEKNEYDLALSELNKALTLSRGQKELLIQNISLEASVLYKMGDYKKAFETYSRGIELYPDNALLLNNYAYYLSEQDTDLKEAKSMIERCLKIESNSTYLDTYAWVLYKMGRYKRADSIMEGLYKDNMMESAEHYEHYGYIRKALNDCDKAVDLWKEAVRINPEKSYLDIEIIQCTAE